MPSKPTPWEQVSHLSPQQVDDLLRLYASEWWTNRRTRADVEAMLAHTDVLIGLCDPVTKRLVAFTRVMTDRVYKALVFDVIVDSSQRGSGLGHALMEAVLSHPQVRHVRHIELYCRPELIPFYQQWGFTTELEGVHFMRLAR